jgi:hypothetical protein
VRGSKHAWTTRIISADALAKLVALKENAELDAVGKIHELLIPFEYTRLDKIIEIAFTVAEEATIALQEERDADLERLSEDPQGVASPKQQRTSQEVISELRTNIITALAAKYESLVKKSRALYWSTDKSVRAAVTISKRYGDSGYWFAYHSNWDKFLVEAKQGFFVLGCLGRSETFALPFEWIHSRRENLNLTERQGESHWHILLYPTDDGQLVLRLKNGQNESLAQFRVVLSQSNATKATAS